MNNSSSNTISNQARQELIGRTERLGLTLSSEQVSQMEKFLLELAEYNSHTNLVAKADPELVIREHIMDSLSLCPFFVQGCERLGGEEFSLVDVGSGAGFPAMVLAIALPQLHVTLIESVGKKTNFLEQAATAIGLEERVTVINTRAEELSRKKEFREMFSFATARAVAKLDLVAELTLPFLDEHGVLFAQKSRLQSEQELKDAERAIQILGGKVQSVDALDPELFEKDLVVIQIEKVVQTPARYPRPTAQLKRPM